VSHSKISALELRIGANVRGAAGHDEFSLGENIGAIGDFETLHNVLLDKQHRNAVSVDALDECKQLLDEQRREPQ
jgi:hypothetical protein